MRITSANSVQFPGLRPALPAVARSVSVPPVAPVSVAAVLQAPRMTDAAWLTLLMAQAFSGPRRIDLTAARRAYEPRWDGHPMTFTLAA